MRRDLRVGGGAPEWRLRRPDRGIAARPRAHRPRHRPPLVTWPLLSSPPPSRAALALRRFATISHLRRLARSPPSHSAVPPRLAVSPLPPPPTTTQRHLKPHCSLFLTATNADDSSPRSSQQPSGNICATSSSRCYSSFLNLHLCHSVLVLLCRLYLFE